MILHTLKNTAGSLMKEQILRMMANTYDKVMFKYAYDMTKMYYLKWNRIDWNTVRDFQDMDRILLDMLLRREYTGSAARSAVEQHCIVYGDLLKLICNKDLDCGVSATTLCKVFGEGFVPQFKVALATEVPIEKIVMPVCAQLKYNGVRVVSIIQDGRVEFRTRNGKTFEYPMLKENIRDVRIYGRDCILDGELTIGDSLGTNHTDVSGHVNSAIKGTPIKFPFTYNVFDCMPTEEFFSQECKVPYRDRYEMVIQLVEKLHPLVRVAETYEVKTREDIQAKFDEVLSKGGEGLILKRWDHKYSFKRSKDWIKLKDVKTADLVCIDVQEGTGKYEGMIGALVCDGAVEGKEVLVNVGSGMTDADRSAPWDDYVGKTIEVKYNQVIQDRAAGGWSLFLPRFVTIRGDL